MLIAFGLLCGVIAWRPCRLSFVCRKGDQVRTKTSLPIWVIRLNTLTAMATLPHWPAMVQTRSQWPIERL